MRYKTNDTTKNTFTGKARAIGGGWYGPRQWPRDTGARVRFALTVGLRLASNATYTTATNYRGAVNTATPTLYLPTGPVEAAQDAAALDRASDLVTAYGMLAGSVKTNDEGAGYLYSTPSEHGYGRTWNPLPERGTNAATLARAYYMDARATSERSDLRPWQIALSKRALETLAAQWLAEAEDSTLAPLERARRARIAALRSPQTVREQCGKDGATIGADPLGPALAAYALACTDADDIDGARAFAEFATESDRDEQEKEERATSEDAYNNGQMTADTNQKTRAREALDYANREARGREALEEEKTPEHERPSEEFVDQDQPTQKDSRENKAGKSEDHAAAAIEAAAEAIHAPTASAPVDQKGKRQSVPQNRPPMSCNVQKHTARDGTAQTYAVIGDGKGEATVVVTPFRKGRR
jgi:hypothetical protein